jgi:predicted 2-oxoglutarate/Fe(II)-dependent dioxygenase YbiX
MKVQIFPSAFPDGCAALIANLLRDPTLYWSARSDPLSASRGPVLQLLNAEQHENAVMEAVRNIILRHAWHYAEPFLNGKLPEDLIPQIFPVMMVAAKNDSPLQLPHRDSFESDGIVSFPLITLIYYHSVEDLTGGELLIFDEVGSAPCIVQKIQPEINHLVVLDGKQLHAVSPMISGRRGSVVTNLYAAK